MKDKETKIITIPNNILKGIPIIITFNCGTLREIRPNINSLKSNVNKIGKAI